MHGAVADGFAHSIPAGPTLAGKPCQPVSSDRPAGSLSDDRERGHFDGGVNVKDAGPQGGAGLAPRKKSARAGNFVSFRRGGLSRDAMRGKVQSVATAPAGLAASRTGMEEKAYGNA
jgi:hypothetical protein